MSKSIDIEYVEQFMFEFRAGYKEFAKPESQDDRKLLDELYAAMEKYDLARQKYADAQTMPPLTIDEANQQVPSGLSGRKHMDKIKELMMMNKMEHHGLFRDVEAFNFKLMLDKVKLRGLVHDSEGVSSKFKDCTEQNVKLQEELREARQRISDLENLARLHGINPSPAPRTLGGDVEEGSG